MQLLLVVLAAFVCRPRLVALLPLAFLCLTYFQIRHALGELETTPAFRRHFGDSRRELDALADSVSRGEELTTWTAGCFLIADHERLANGAVVLYTHLEREYGPAGQPRRDKRWGVCALRRLHG